MIRFKLRIKYGGETREHEDQSSSGSVFRCVCVNAQAGEFSVVVQPGEFYITVEPGVSVTVQPGVLPHGDDYNELLSTQQKLEFHVSRTEMWLAHLGRWKAHVLHSDVSHLLFCLFTSYGTNYLKCFRFKCFHFFV